MNPMVQKIDDEDAAAIIHGDAARAIKLAVALSLRAPLAEVTSRRRKILDPVVVIIRYVNATVGAGGDVGRKPELAVAAPVRTPLTYVIAGRREILYPVVVRVSYVYVIKSRLDALGTIELPVAGNARAPTAFIPTDTGKLRYACADRFRRIDGPAAVASRRRDVNAAGRVGRAGFLCFPLAPITPHGVKILNPVVAGVRNVNVPVIGDSQGRGLLKLPAS